MNKNLIWIIGGVAILGGFLVWLFVASSQPLPGQKIDDLGRGHVQIGTEVTYNSNPPTSGKHYEDWVRAGVYETPRDDRNLVHSLEHGYVILSYNCDWKVQSRLITSVYAHGIEEEASPSSTEATPSASVSEDCHKLVDQLISIYEKKGKTRLIVIPRPNLDARIALTAWNYIDKFNPSTGSTSSPQASSGLSVSEIERTEKFIDAHLNMGPEKTMETAGN